MVASDVVVTKAKTKTATAKTKKGIHVLIKMASVDLEHLVARCLATFHTEKVVTISSLE